MAYRNDKRFLTQHIDKQNHMQHMKIKTRELQGSQMQMMDDILEIIEKNLNLIWVHVRPKKNNANTKDERENFFAHGDF